MTIKNLIIILLIFLPMLCFGQKYGVNSSELRKGWEYLKDDEYVTGSRLSIIQGDTAILTNNGNASLIRSQLPIGVDSLFNRSTNLFQPVKDGDMYALRIDFKGSSSNGSGDFILAIDIGGGQGRILEIVQAFPRGSAQEHPFSISLDVFSGSTFIANGGEISIYSTTGDTEIWDIAFLIEKTYHGR